MPSKIFHKAVLDEDLKTLRLLRDARQLKEEQDERGYSAIELAYYLDKPHCLRVLREWNPGKLKIYSREGNEALEYNEAEIEATFGFRFVPTLIFPSYDFFLETIANCPLLLKYSSLGKECRNLGKGFQHGLSADTAVRWIDETFGYGLYAETDIAAGTLIGEYTGIVRRLPRGDPNPNGYCVHYPTRWWSRDYTVIDAWQAGNALRFVNHSDMPNLRAAWALDRGLLHLLFLAKEAIPVHTQLTIDYGPDYWQFRKKL